MMDGQDYEEQEPAPPGMFPGRFGMPGPPGFGAPFAGRKIPGFNEHGMISRYSFIQECDYR